MTSEVLLKKASAVKKFGDWIFFGLEPCNPLESHKTAKAF